MSMTSGLRYSSIQQLSSGREVELVLLTKLCCQVTRILTMNFGGEPICRRISVQRIVGSIGGLTKSFLWSFIKDLPTSARLRLRSKAGFHEIHLAPDPQSSSAGCTDESGPTRFKNLKESWISATTSACAGAFAFASDARSGASSSAAIFRSFPADLPFLAPIAQHGWLLSCCQTVLKSRPVKTWGLLTVVAMQCLAGQWRKKRN
jgi:hypothetical protein